MDGMTQEHLRVIGRAIMALSLAQLVFFLGGAVRRSYLVVAIPTGILSGVLAGVGVWVGYTMATTNWDHPADWPPPSDLDAAEGAPPPDALG